MRLAPVNGAQGDEERGEAEGSIHGHERDSHAHAEGDEGGSANLPRDSTTTIEAKWLGACKPDQKAGDIVMPGGVKMNVKDMEKLKALMPKQPPK